MGEDYSERITAGALRNRGLVTTTGRGRTWSAAITKEGIDYLARVDGPNPPIPREPNRPVSQRLVDEVIAAGGTLRVPRRPWGAAGTGQPDYERRVALAEHRGVVPPGKRLVITRDRGELQIDLRDAPEGSPTAPMPVPVPERVARYHPVVTEFRGQKDRHEVSRAQLPRVSRILQGLVIEAERRGYAVRLPSKAKVSQQGCPDWSGDADGHLLIVIGDVRVALRVREDGIRGRAIYPRHDYRYRTSTVLPRAPTSTSRARRARFGSRSSVRARDRTGSPPGETARSRPSSSACPQCSWRSRRVRPKSASASCSSSRRPNAGSSHGRRRWSVHGVATPSTIASRSLTLRWLRGGERPRFGTSATPSNSSDVVMRRLPSGLLGRARTPIGSIHSARRWRSRIRQRR